MSFKIILTACAVFISLTVGAMAPIDAMSHRLKDQKSFTLSELCDSFATVGASTADGYAACKERNLSQVKAQYSLSAKTLKKPNERAAFKIYHLAVLGQFKALEVKSGETVREFKRRQSEASTKTDEAWTAFEVEAGF